MNRLFKEKLQEIVNMLEESARAIRALEAKAEEALYVHGDMEMYKSNLVQKAIFILEMTDELDGRLEGLDSDLKTKIKTRLNHFAHEAGQALHFSSLFYMSTLLHVSGAKEDETNDLEKFIAELKCAFVI